ncbi:hypothetical protein [Pseudomonas sp. PSKL.D1]|uniref:hypothetical protein n=1 Tax=Pseudomonas sp. PSKL.D1 TaxID=3029060 RepID=UPI002380D960|nr:hypothetical protein [Pseudomonas sp. PSKL.D1]WDY60231.1 hypothetical protein PVV54_11580 [Pseudomonas sp. PSKL.D1]
MSTTKQWGQSLLLAAGCTMSAPVIANVGKELPFTLEPSNPGLSYEMRYCAGRLDELENLLEARVLQLDYEILSRRDYLAQHKKNTQETLDGTLSLGEETVKNFYAAAVERNRQTLRDIEKELAAMSEKDALLAEIKQFEGDYGRQVTDVLGQFDDFTFEWENCFLEGAGQDSCMKETLPILESALQAGKKVLDLNLNKVKLLSHNERLQPTDACREL